MSEAELDSKLVSDSMNRIYVITPEDPSGSALLLGPEVEEWFDQAIATARAEGARDITKGVTRVTVIPPEGQASEWWNVSPVISMQDNDRTLKLFVNPPADSSLREAQLPASKEE